MEVLTPLERQTNPITFTQPDYTEEEWSYYNFLIKRLQLSRDLRNRTFDEFNRRSYVDRYKDNMEKAYTLIEPLKNEYDTSVDTGTSRYKVESVVSAILNLNFAEEVRAYDLQDISDDVLGDAMTDLIKKSEIIEDWDTKKILAYWEQVSQGNVFIEEVFVDETRIDKKKISLRDINSETFKNFKPVKSIKKVFSGCKRNIIAGTQYYPGNIYEPTVAQQPFIFTKDVLAYDEAQAIYGHFPRWKDVPTKIHEVEPEWSRIFILEREQLRGEMVEVIKYQDKWNDEYMILCNGVMMLPIEFPMPWEHAEYNIVKGDFEPIHPFFHYSKSMVEKSKFEQEVLNEMFRLMVLNTQKKFMPPIANNTANNLTKNDFLPGKVLNDIDPKEIGIVGGPYGVSSDEMAVVNYIRGIIDDKSIRSIVQGVAPEGTQTATEITAIMSQAKQQLGLIIAGFINLHKQLGLLRLYDILEYWVGDKKSYSIEKNLAGRGKGVKQINFTKNMTGKAALMAKEQGLQYEGMTGKEQSIFDLSGKPMHTYMSRPLQIVEINPETLRSIKYNWFIEVTPHEKDTSLVAKAEFEQSLMTALNLWPEILQDPEIKERWAVLNKFNPRVLNKAPMGQGMGQGMPPQVGKPSGVPTMNEMSTPMMNPKQPYTRIKPPSVQQLAGADLTRQA